MRALVWFMLLFIPASFPSDCVAEGRYVKLTDPPQERTAEEEQILSEIQTLLARLKKSRPAEQQITLVLWKRWTHAVCIGCDPTPKGMRVVHTYPLRVLAGILSTTDDARERRRQKM